MTDNSHGSMTTALQKVDELESVRGLAALLVLLYHLPKWNPILDIGVINNGYLMVELFFVLSGFVICRAYSERIETKNDLYKFQLLRFWRLYPVHIIFLFVFLAIEIARYIVSESVGITSPKDVPFERNNLYSFVKNIFLIQSVLPNQNFTFNGPAWSISVEFYTYFVFGCIVLFFKQKSRWLFMSFSFFSILLLLLDKTYGFVLLLRCFAGFFSGCLVALLIRKLKPNLPAGASLFSFAAIICFLHFKNVKYIDVLIFPLAASLIFTLSASSRSTLGLLLRCKPLLWLGSISYSLYMAHTAILLVCNSAIRFFYKAPVTTLSNGVITPQLSQMETFFAIVVVLAVTLIVSQLIFEYIEKPMREKSRSLYKPAL